MVQSKFNLYFWFVSYSIFSIEYALCYSKYRVRERIEYHFRVSNAAVFILYSYSKVLEYHLEYTTAASFRVSFRVSTVVSLNKTYCFAGHLARAGGRTASVNHAGFTSKQKRAQLSYQVGRKCIRSRWAAAIRDSAHRAGSGSSST
jgi:hypothetical protein